MELISTGQYTPEIALTGWRAADAQKMIDIGLPRELAVMIAERTDNEDCALTGEYGFDTVAGHLWSAFSWTLSPEGQNYWGKVVDALEAEYGTEEI
mgnify:CR=1 FL=1